MIKVNLIEKKKRKQEIYLAGVNVKEIKWVPLFIAALWYFIDGNLLVLNTVFEEREGLVNKDIETLQAEKKKLIKEKEGLKDLDEEIKKFELVESKLQQRLAAVKEVLANRKNPQEIMLYIAKSIPTDVWVTSFSINQNEMMIDGKATNYRSIGTFLEALRSSTFFGSDVRLSGTSTEQDKTSTRRSEVFKIQGNVARFE